jgi:hypothetical protein
MPRVICFAAEASEQFFQDHLLHVGSQIDAHRNDGEPEQRRLQLDHDLGVEATVGGEYIDPGFGGRRDPRTKIDPGMLQRPVNRPRFVRRFDAEAEAGMPLRIEIPDQDAVAAGAELGGKIDCDGRLAVPPFRFAIARTLARIEIRSLAGMTGPDSFLRGDPSPTYAS